MAIFRALKDGNFTQMTNKVIDRNNPNKLSPEAVGILFYMLSNKDDWQFYEQEIAEHFNCGITKIKSGIKELINNGYIVVIKKNGADGRFKWVYDVYEDPDLNPSKGKTMSGDPSQRGTPCKVDTSPVQGGGIHPAGGTNNKKGKIKKEEEKESPSLFNLNNCNTVNAVIDYLNVKAGTHFKPTIRSYVKEITGRLKEGYKLDNFKYVIDVKVAEWKDDKKMRQYLNPETLFKASNFDKYLNQPMPIKSVITTPRDYYVDDILADLKLNGATIDKETLITTLKYLKGNKIINSDTMFIINKPQGQ